MSSAHTSWSTIGHRGRAKCRNGQALSSRWTFKKFRFEEVSREFWEISSVGNVLFRPALPALRYPGKVKINSTCELFCGPQIDDLEIQKENSRETRTSVLNSKFGAMTLGDSKRFWCFSGVAHTLLRIRKRKIDPHPPLHPFICGRKIYSTRFRIVNFILTK